MRITRLTMYTMNILVGNNSNRDGTRIDDPVLIFVLNASSIHFLGH